jgi:hypothetical protein
MCFTWGEPPKAIGTQSNSKMTIQRIFFTVSLYSAGRSKELSGEEILRARGAPCGESGSRPGNGQVNPLWCKLFSSARGRRFTTLDCQDLKRHIP